MPQTTRREEEGVFFFFLSPLLRASMSRDNDVSLSPTEHRRAQSRASPSRHQTTTHTHTTKPPTTPLRSTLSLVLPPWLPPTPATNSTITRFSSLKETNLAQAYQSQERLFMLLSSDPPFRSNTSHWTDSKHCPLVLHSPAPSDQSSIILFQKFTSPLVRPEPVGYRKQTTGK